MRPILDEADLTAVHSAGRGLVHNPKGQILHVADCPQVSRMGPKGKLFFESLEEADAYLSGDVRRRWSRCPTCLAGERSTAARAPASAAPVSEAAAPAAVRSLTNGFEVVADRPVPFEPRTDEQRALRSQLRESLRTLAAGDGQVLHARLAGSLAPGTDVENVLLYNVDQGGASLVGATRAGIRFEVDREPMPRGVRYRYGLAPADAGFESWRIGRELAAIRPCALGSRLRCSTAWWALKAGDADVSNSALRPGERFAVLLDVEGPGVALRPEALKVLIDATVCSLQAHSDVPSISEPARRLGLALDVSADVIADALRDERRAALGARPRLVQPWGKTVQWLPHDHLCVAGDVRYRPAPKWRLSGRVCVVE